MKRLIAFFLLLSPIKVNANDLLSIREDLDLGKNPVVIIWGHGQSNVRRSEKCSADFNKIPKTLKYLEKEIDAHFIFMCSKSIDNDYRRGSYIYKRVRQLKKLLTEINEIGVHPNNIFISGFSAGGWTALHMFRENEKLFNSAIVFAPAFAGPRYEIRKYPKWRKVVRPAHIKKITKAKVIDALVFAYEDDSHNRPEELKFLTEIYPKNVNIVGYNCKNGHLTHINDCKSSETEILILNYINQQINAKNYHL
ncbi:hypothetical protein [Prochlorococcus marinus]|nr:hypothetical protein [Prochlorococcus marinus]MBO8218065.1 hypothetical protein [Prochlorococcus marinus XMU1405]